MMKLIQWMGVAVLISLLFTGVAHAGDDFSAQVGDVAVGDVKADGAIDLPFITWGGDMVTFYANGGKTTTANSLFAKQGLNFNLIAGDDFTAQVRNYLAGRTPYLRGTFRMIAQASEVLAKDPRTKPVVIMQLTWSAGDHLVTRDGKLKLTKEGLKGRKFVLQRGGPHVGMLDDILNLPQVKLKWSDITVIWADDLTATDKSPLAIFKKDTSINGCFVISPDMLALTGGLDKTGSGAEGTLKGAQVSISTAHLTRSISDVYVVRSDYLKAHPELVTKFVGGYLKAAEEVKAHQAKSSAEYRALLTMTQTIYGNEVIPSTADADGLFQDCKLVGYPGNLAFFKDSANLRGFEVFNKNGIEMAVSQGYAKAKAPLLASTLDWDQVAKVGGLTKTSTARTEHFNVEGVTSELDRLEETGALESNTATSFAIHFDPNQREFPADQYQKQFDEALNTLSTFGGAVILLKGHTDPKATVEQLVLACRETGILKMEGEKGSRRFFIDGDPLDVSSMDAIKAAISAGKCDGAHKYRPRQFLAAARSLSMERAKAVREAVIGYARVRGIHVDASQIHFMGMGITEPVVAQPMTADDHAKNRRVEFAVITIDPETSVESSDFSY